MEDNEPLSPAASAEFSQALAFGLKFNGRKRIHSGDDLMAQLMAEHLVRYLDSTGFVVMKRPPARAHSAGGGPPAKA